MAIKEILMNLQENIDRIQSMMGINESELETSEKVLIYIYFCDYEDENFKKYVDKFNKIDIDFWVKPGKGHHRGFALQSILNTSNLGKAEKIATRLFKIFDENILIVLSKQMVTNIEPVGENQEDVFVLPGRTFDELVTDKKKGIYTV